MDAGVAPSTAAWPVGGKLDALCKALKISYTGAAWDASREVGEYRIKLGPENQTLDGCRWVPLRPDFPKFRSFVKETSPSEEMVSGVFDSVAYLMFVLASYDCFDGLAQDLGKEKGVTFLVEPPFSEQCTGVMSLKEQARCFGKSLAVVLRDFSDGSEQLQINRCKICCGDRRLQDACIEGVKDALREMIEQERGNTRTK